MQIAVGPSRRRSWRLTVISAALVWRNMRILLGIGALIVFASSCGGDPCCGAVYVPPLCPEQIAFDVTVTTAAGTAIPGLAYSISGPSGPAGCLVVNGV